ncbi:MAG: hypothetical protein ABEN55_15010 [Bradymonadaceae bacterium]
MPTPAGRRTWPLAAIALLLAVAGCSRPDPTIEVAVCGDVPVPRRIDSIRVTLLDSDRQVRQQGVVELLMCPAGRVRSLPVALSLSPIEGTGYIQVQGLKEGKVVIEIEKKAELTRESGLSVRLPLTRACLGVLSCPVGQTCVQGACRVAPPADRELRCQSEETSDMMRDTGIDTTGRDAGPSPDAGGANTSTEPDPGAPRSLCPDDTGTSSDTADGADNDGGGSRG